MISSFQDLLFKNVSGFLQEEREWLDNFLKYYQAEAPITGFLEDESVSIER